MKFCCAVNGYMRAHNSESGNYTGVTDVGFEVLMTVYQHLGCDAMVSVLPLSSGPKSKPSE
jgi:hypothetical protein